MFLQEKLRKKKAEESAKPKAKRSGGADGGNNADNNAEAIAELEKALEAARLEPAIEAGAAFVIVDPISTGATLALDLQNRGAKCIQLYSRAFPPAFLRHTPDGAEAVDWAGTVQHDGRNVKRTAKLLTNLRMPIAGVIAGCETGVDLARALAIELNLRGNPDSPSFHSKSETHARATAAGLLVPRQVEASVWEDAEETVKALLKEGGKVVVKPSRSAGSDGVRLCETTEAAKAHFLGTLGQINIMGMVNKKVLVQEYLQGKEYVVDTVSRDGKHKVSAIWEVGTRPGPLASFVQHSATLLSGSEKNMRDVCAFVKQTLDAVNVSNGPATTKVIVTREKSCALLECSPCVQGGNGVRDQLARMCLGYSQTSVISYTYLDPVRFLKTPSRPRLRERFGAELCMVATRRGKLRSLPSLPSLEKLPSYNRTFLRVEPGDEVAPCVDALGSHGSLLLVAESREGLVNDLEKAWTTLHAKEFFDLEETDNASAAEGALNGVPSSSSLLRSFTPAKFSLSKSFLAGSLYQDGGILAGSGGGVSMGNSLRDHRHGRQALEQLTMTPRTADDLVLGSLLGKTPDASHTRAVIVVDPMSTGGSFAQEMYGTRKPRGNPKTQILRVFSQPFPEDVANYLPPDCDLEFCATVQHNGDLEETLALIKALPYEVTACVPGLETGVELSDELAVALNLRNNGLRNSTARRNKYLMGEQVRRCGVRAVMQADCKTWAEAEAFLEELNPVPYRVIIKPLASAGSDGVFLCRSAEEVKGHFDDMMGELDHFGGMNSSMLVQEFLEGPEYVVDTVSKDGVHKCTAVWRYDKRSMHGRHNVYFGMNLINGNDPIAREIIEYQFKVLTALDINNGGGHGEVMYTPTGPCLVEVGARTMGAAGSWLPIAETIVGHSSVQAWADLVLNPAKHDSLPTYPVFDEKKAGNMYNMHSKAYGRFLGMNQEILSKIKALPSVMGVFPMVKVGGVLQPTVDVVTIPAFVAVAAETMEQRLKDEAVMREIEVDLFLSEPLTEEEIANIHH